MELAILNIDGKETGRKVKLNDSIFGIEPNDHAIYLDTKQFLANQRQGTHKSKERGEIAGSTRKIKRQKGTGTARAGSIKNPLFRGGGRDVRSQDQDITDSSLIRKSNNWHENLLFHIRHQQIILLFLKTSLLKLQKPRRWSKWEIYLNIANKKSVFVLPEQNNNIYLSSRNVQGVEVIIASELNTYKIMRASTLILVESAVDVLQATFEN